MNLRVVMVYRATRAIVIYEVGVRSASATVRKKVSIFMVKDMSMK